MIEAKKFPPEYQNLVKAPRFESRFLSDTLVIAASVKPRRRNPRKVVENAVTGRTGMDLAARNAAIDACMRYLVCECVCSAIRAAALAAKPIAYRGVVSVGYFALDDNFLLGPAVDEAAGLMDKADGAFVWLAPSAARLKHVLYPVKGDRWSDMTIKERLPFKDGRSCQMTMLNPFCIATDDESKLMRQNLLRSMSGDALDVVLKRQNTRRFFDAVKSRTERFAKDKARRREKKILAAIASIPAEQPPPKSPQQPPRSAR